MPFKIGFVGFGRVIEWHINLMPSNVQPIFICDISEERLDRASNLFPEISTYNNVSNLTSDLDVDAVVIATPSGIHYDISDLIRQIFPDSVLVIEKPTFLAPRHFQEAFGWCNPIVPIFQNRYNPSVVKALGIINSGSIGMISHASLSLDWSRPQRYYDLADWRGTWFGDGGVSTNQGIHYFDITRLLLGNIVSITASMRRIHASIECEDYLTASALLANNVPLDIRMTTALRVGHEEAKLIIHGSKARLKLYGVCCNNLEIAYDSGSIESFEHPVPCAYGYGHREFYKKLALRDYSFSSLKDSYSTMSFIYLSYLSAIEGRTVHEYDDFSDIPLGQSHPNVITFA